MSNRNKKIAFECLWKRLKDMFGAIPRHAHHNHATRSHHLKTNLPCPENTYSEFPRAI